MVDVAGDPQEYWNLVEIKEKIPKSLGFQHFNICLHKCGGDLLTVKEFLTIPNFQTFVNFIWRLPKYSQRGGS